MFAVAEPKGHPGVRPPLPRPALRTKFSFPQMFLR